MPSKRCLQPERGQRPLSEAGPALVLPSVRSRTGMVCGIVVFLGLLHGIGRAADSSAVLSGGFLASRVMAGSGKSAEDVEYQVKAAFIYNFMKFTEWPAEKMKNGGEESASDSSAQPMLIGIVGDNPFGKAFEPLMDKKIKDRPLKLVFIPGMGAYAKKYSDKEKAAEQYWQEQGKTLQSCHVLFYCKSEKNWLAEHLERVREYPLLTIGEEAEFLTFKGLIAFVMEENKVRFEIYLTQAERQGLKISSQLLKLARRVIQEKESNGK